MYEPGGSGDNGAPAVAEAEAGETGESGEAGASMAGLEAECPTELAACLATTNCATFLENAMNAEDEPTEEAAAAAGPETTAILKCYPMRI